MERGHAEALAPLVQRVMATVEGGFSSLDRVAATVGPGSFTGVRIGLATARAIGLALSIPVIGVSTLAAFAGPLLIEPKAGPIASAIDARHGQLYLQLFESNGRPLGPPRVINSKEGARSIGAGPARLTGSGARLLAAEAQAVGLAVESVAYAAFPDILAVARLGLVAEPHQAPPRPLYLKAPSAQRPENPAIARVSPQKDAS